MRFAARFVSTVILLNFSVLLSSAAGPPSPQILVAAAADLHPLQTALTKSSPIQVVFTFAASGTLAQQIRHGAPYDVYLSANERFVKELADAGLLLRETVRVYAQGRLGLWSKSGRIKTLQDLSSPSIRHIAIANPTHAPYGAAAKAALQNQRLWEQLEPKIVYGENVEQTFQYARSGNADAAITSWTLVFDKGGIQLPANLHPPISQSGGVVSTTRHKAEAIKFLQFLASEEGHSILERVGQPSAK
jgi:molybdate transport system substrate-binding protein